MRVQGKPVSELEFADLERLVEDGVPESRVLDYKERLPGTSDSQKKKFLRNVSALANTAGGAIIYGVVEEQDADGDSTGVPAAIPGLPDVENFDEMGLRYEQRIRNGLQPPLTRAEVHFIETDNDPCMVIGIPQSLLGPHAVWYKQDGRFYRRAGRGVYQVEVEELRQMFLEKESWQEEADQFRRERISSLLRGDIGPGLAKRNGGWLQVLPLGRISHRLNIEGMEAEMAPPAGGARRGGRHLVEGYVIPDESPARSYTLYFYNGGTEGYLGLDLVEVDEDRIASKQLEKKLMDYARSFFSWLHECEVDPPYGVFLSLVGVKRKKLTTGPGFRRGVPKQFDRDKVFLPGITVNSSQPDVEEEMQPVLNIMWQACGFDGSPYYDEDGNWTG